MSELTDEERAEIELFETEGGMSDGLFARSIVIGAAIGVPVMGVLVWGLFSISDISISDKGILALALWSALWAGLLIGGVLGVGMKLLRLENKMHDEGGH
jgi:hypothetical protein